MCGRYTLRATTEELSERFAVQLVAFAVRPRFNIAPGQDVAAIVASAGGRTLTSFKWGLVPFWARDLKKTKPMINARRETLSEKPTFKSALKQRRCLIPADGYYEWQVTAAGKIPVHITPEDGGLFAFAGLWDEWKGEPDGSLRTCTIVTVPAPEELSVIHDRMPAILARADEEAWLDASITDAPSLLALIRSPAGGTFGHRAVGNLVNSPRNETPACLEPI